MTDLKERLRGHPGEGKTVTQQFRNMVEQRHEAAAEIERLEEQLRAVLKHVEDLRAERHTTKRMLEEVLSRHGLPRP